MSDAYREYTLLHTRSETPSVTTLTFIPKKGGRPRFVAGQFVNVLSPTGGVESKSYSIKSSPDDPHLSLSVRAIGKTSRALCALRCGESVRMSEPCGFFYPVDDKTPRVFVAGGIGIAPFMSILKDSLTASRFPTAHLLYSNRLRREAPFLEELSGIKSRAFSMTCFFTREPVGDAGAVYGRISEAHLRTVMNLCRGAHYFLCGGISFVRDLRLLIKSLGVEEENIFTESFF